VTYGRVNCLAESVSESPNHDKVEHIEEPIQKEHPNLEEKGSSIESCTHMQEPEESSAAVVVFNDPNKNELESKVGKEIKQLIDHIIALHDSKGHISFWMSVDTSTSKATMIPFPTKDNLLKFKENFDQLPRNVRMVMKKSITPEDKEEIDRVWKVLDSITGQESKDEEKTSESRRALRM
jgi:hypothetical protein